MGELYEDTGPVQPVPISVRQAPRLLASSPLPVSLGVGAGPAALQVCDHKLAAAVAVAVPVSVCLWDLTKALSMVLNTGELLKATERAAVHSRKWICLCLCYYSSHNKNSIILSKKNRPS